MSVYSLSTFLQEAVSFSLSLGQALNYTKYTATCVFFFFLEGGYARIYTIQITYSSDAMVIHILL